MRNGKTRDNGRLHETNYTMHNVFGKEGWVQEREIRQGSRSVS
jgi:hypothetical protein